MASCIPGCRVTADWDTAKWPAKSAARVILVPACKATLISRASQAVEVCACRRCEGFRLCPYTAVVTLEHHHWSNIRRHCVPKSSKAGSHLLGWNVCLAAVPGK